MRQALARDLLHAVRQGRHSHRAVRRSGAQRAHEMHEAQHASLLGAIEAGEARRGARSGDAPEMEHEIGGLARTSEGLEQRPMVLGRPGAQSVAAFAQRRERGALHDLNDLAPAPRRTRARRSPRPLPSPMSSQVPADTGADAAWGLRLHEGT